jgi:hypothetical protein
MLSLNVFGLIGFSRGWYSVVFGLPKVNTDTEIVDLTLKEIFILLYCFFFLLFFTYMYLFSI